MFAAQILAIVKVVPRQCLAGFMSRTIEQDGPNNTLLSLNTRTWVTGFQKILDSCEAVKLQFPTVSKVESYNLHIV